MNVTISGDVYAMLNRVAGKIGTSTTALLRAAADNAESYLAGMNPNSLSPVEYGHRMHVSGRVALEITNYAALFNRSPGRILDYLLRNALPVIEYNKETYESLKQVRNIVKIDAFVYSKLCQARDRDRDYSKLSITDFLWFTIKDLSNEDVAKLFAQATTQVDKYRNRDSISIELPHSLYSLLMMTLREFQVSKFSLLSAFVENIVNWLGQPVRELPEIPPPAVDQESFQRLIVHAFELGVGKR
jgi:hypothetical protein